MGMHVNKNTHNLHTENAGHTESAQVTFSKEVRTFVRVIEDMGDPFTEDSGDVIFAQEMLLIQQYLKLCM